MVELSISPLSLAYNPSYVPVFQSSVFFTPKTQLAYDTYVGEFSRHRATRISAWESALSGSSDPASFLSYLTDRLASYQDVASRNDALTMDIAKMPLWLSTSSDSTVLPFDSNWRVYNCHSPNDVALWILMVEAGANFFKQLGIPMLYEVWNEPANYWLESDQNYLELYAVTSEAIKTAHPAAKVGGAALASSESHAANNLNLQLIAYAKLSGVHLDFLSWHNYEADPALIFTPKAEAQAVIDASGLTPQPGFLVTEWNNNSGLRATEYAPAYVCEKILAFAQNGMDGDIFTFFDDPTFSAGTGGRGLLHNDGTKKHVYHAYRFMHQMSVPGTGIAYVQSGTVKILITGTSGQYRLVFWDYDNGPSIDPSTDTYSLSFGGFSRAAVLSCQSVRSALQTKTTSVSGNTVTLSMQRNEVVTMDVSLEVIQNPYPFSSVPPKKAKKKCRKGASGMSRFQDAC